MGKKKKKQAEKHEKKTGAKKLLKGQHCTGCKKHCPLKDPHCKKGRIQAEALLKQR